MPRGKGPCCGPPVSVPSDPLLQINVNRLRSGETSLWLEPCIPGTAWGRERPRGNIQAPGRMEELGSGMCVCDMNRYSRQNNGRQTNKEAIQGEKKIEGKEEKERRAGERKKAEEKGE